MAGSDDDRLVQSRRLRRSGGELEEGEVVSGYYTGSDTDTDTDDEDARYYLHPVPLHDHRDRQGMMVTVARPGHDPVLEDVVIGRASAGSMSRSRSTTRASSPTTSLGSDGTISDHADAGVDASAVTALFPACPVCHRQFRSSKAVHGHMRVHALAQPKEVEKVSATVSAVDKVAGYVSLSTSTAVEELASSEQVVPSGGRSSNSASVQKPSQSTADQSMAIVVAGAAPPAAVSEQVHIAASPPASQQDPVAPPFAPAPEPAAAYLHPPAPAQQHAFVPPLAAAAPRHAFHGPLHIIAHRDTSAPRGFSCKECNRWFPTHQGLGGHAAGHKNRRIAAEAAAAIDAGLDPIGHAAGGSRSERLHTCKVCGEVYTSGVRLGGHMRKHYQGKPIVPRKRARLLLPPDVLGLAVPGPAPQAPAAVVAAAPLQAPAVPAGCVRLFGVTIVPEAKKEEKEPCVDDKQ
ncbi:hypothetical protein CFC21_044144 [Triticum aestivum]|uniref:C2H2-type domain-containing protein n=2 Tax=Triticum aestivum TaxID=4565 RepID=A0A3B6FWY9_WHEAT|nr:hypothetical protein CFC21_044144 [Triticum aestivum]